MVLMSKSVFTEIDYNLDNGFMVSIWGPPLWHVLHTISFNYPVEPTSKQQLDYYKFYNNLKNILPCKYCRENLKKNLKKLPLTKAVFKNRESLSRWVFDLHEVVNKMLGKKSGLSYEMVRDRYENFRSRCLSTDKSINLKKEKGCSDALYGIKSKCVLNIIPNTVKTNSLKISPACKIKRK